MPRPSAELSGLPSEWCEGCEPISRLWRPPHEGDSGNFAAKEGSIAMHEYFHPSFGHDQLTSPNLARAVEYGRAVQGELRPDDPRLDNTVHLACKDGTNLNLPHAFMETTGDWVYVFTRDHGYFVEHKDSLAACTTSERAAT